MATDEAYICPPIRSYVGPFSLLYYEEGYSLGSVRCRGLYCEKNQRQVKQATKSKLTGQLIGFTEVVKD